MAEVVTVMVPDLPTAMGAASDNLIAVWDGARLSKIPQAMLRGTRTYTGASSPPADSASILALEPILGDRWRNTLTGDEWKVTSLVPFVWTPDGTVRGLAGVSNEPGPPGATGKTGRQGERGERGADGVPYIITRVASGNVPPSSCLVAKGGALAEVLDPTDVTQRGKALGVSALGAADGAIVTIQGFGDLDGVFGDFVDGDVLYASPTGGLTSIPPASGWVQEIATAASTTKIVVNMGVASLVTPAEDALVLSGGGFARKADDTDAANAARDREWVSGAGLFSALEVRAPGRSVREYGARPNAPASVNTAAFARAYAENPAGATIYVPPGAYAGSMPTGTKYMSWVIDGATDQNPNGPYPLVLPGIVQGIYEGRRLIQKTARNGDQQPAVEIVVRGGTGGSLAGVATAFSAVYETAANQTDGAWTGLFLIEGNSSLGNDAAQNAALEVVARQNVREGTSIFACAFAAEELHGLGNPTSNILGIEVSTMAHGTDDNNCRTLVFLPAQKKFHDRPGRVEIAHGIYMAAGDETVLKTGFRYEGEYNYFLRSTGSKTNNVVIDISQDTCSHGLRLHEGQKVEFDAAGFFSMAFQNGAVSVMGPNGYLFQMFNTGSVRLPFRNSDPEPENSFVGMIYFNTNLDTFRFRGNTGWKNMSSN